MKKLTFISFSLTALILAILGCSDVRRDPGTVYMPDMGSSRAYETYSESPIYADRQTNREPVAGTVKRGDLFPFHLAADKVGDTTNYYASRQVRNPLPALTETELKESERLYLINCAICHGSKLDGDGPLWKDGDGPFPSKPATLVGEARYEVMPEGQMYYAVTYGKNLMGSYAAQLNPRQRWMVITYIKSKQAKPAPAAPGAATQDTTKVVAAK